MPGKKHSLIASKTKQTWVTLFGRNLGTGVKCRMFRCDPDGFHFT